MTTPKENPDGNADDSPEDNIGPHAQNSAGKKLFNVQLIPEMSLAHRSKSMAFVKNLYAVISKSLL
jgi:hypothetical protein